MSVCVCLYVCLSVCMYVSMYLCIYVSMYLCIYVSMYVCMYLCIYVSMYVCMYACMVPCPVSRVPCSRERELGGPYHWWGGARDQESGLINIYIYIEIHRYIDT